MNANTSALETRFRIYRDSDAETIRELFKESITVGGDSPMLVALRAQFTSRSALALYAMSALGIFLAAWSPTTRIGYLGFFLCLLGTATFSFLIYTRFSGFMYFAENAGRTDLKDVPKTYRLRKETKTGEYVTNGSNGFWVAEVYNAEGAYTEVVGCAGLDVSQMNPHDNSIELRRMVVSSRYRRRGIASRLIKIAIAHAQAHCKQYIDLTTSSYQESALGMYEKHGWVIRRRWVLMGTNFYTHQLRRYLD